MFRRYLPDIRRRSPVARKPHRMVDLMDGFFNDFLESFPETEFNFPKVNVSENDKEVTVKAELPGMDPKDVDISIQNNVLVLKGEKKFEEEHTEGDFHRVECSYGSINRTIQLPAEVDPEKVKAKCKNGVLNIKMPKTEGSKTKKIEIEG